MLAHIRVSGLRPGDRLPAERDLARELGVSRASVAQALVALEILGVVSVRHGNGAVTGSLISDQQVADALRAHAKRLPDIIEARSALEVKLAALAVERRTDADLQAIDDALAAMAADLDAGGRGIEGDEEFHAAVTAAGYSPLLARLMREISGLILETGLSHSANRGDRCRRWLVTGSSSRAFVKAIRPRPTLDLRSARGGHAAPLISTQPEDVCAQ